MINLASGVVIPATVRALQDCGFVVRNVGDDTELELPNGWRVWRIHTAACVVDPKLCAQVLLGFWPHFVNGRIVRLVGTSSNAGVDTRI